MKRLHTLGVNVKTGFRIAEVKAKAVVSAAGEELQGDVIVWTGGVRASSVVKTFGVPVSKRQQIPVLPTLQLPDDAAVFCIGDAAEFQVSDTDYAPMTAHEAVHQAETAANNIGQLLHGRTELEPYVIKNEGYVITTGGKTGIVELPSGRALTGAIGWFARKFVDFRHFRSVLPFMQAYSVFMHGFRVGIKNDRRV